MPRRNGELAFEAPWESRVFGMVAAYLDATGRPWEDFRRRLIVAISASPPDTPYYVAWTDAFADLLRDDGSIGNDELVARVASIEAEA